jgi:DNA polymerase-1
VRARTLRTVDAYHCLPPCPVGTASAFKLAAIEMRLAAALAGDASLAAAVANGDVHQAVAHTLGVTRAVAKTVNFGVLYGMGAHGLALRLGVETNVAGDYINRWWTSFRAVRALRDRLGIHPQLTPWGRQLPSDDVPDHIRLNHLIQGSGRDIFCDGLLALEDAGLDHHLLLPLHDEYVVQLPADQAASLAATIASLVRVRLSDVDLPVETNLGGRSWANVGAS